MKTPDYGIIREEEATGVAKTRLLPGEKASGGLFRKQTASGSITGNSLPQADAPLLTTGMFQGIPAANGRPIQNHCGAVCCANIAKLFYEAGWKKALIDEDPQKTFFDLHGRIGNGPVLSLKGGLEEYFSLRGFTLHSRSVGDYENLCREVDAGHPVAVLLSAGLFQWHWVLAVGWFEIRSSEKAEPRRFIRITDNWNPEADRAIEIQKGALWVAGRAYWL